MHVGRAFRVDNEFYSTHSTLQQLCRRSRNYDGLPLARSASRRSGGSARSRGAGGGGAKKKAAGGGTRRSGGGGGGGVGAKRKRSRADFDEVEFEEEFDEDVELSGERGRQHVPPGGMQCRKLMGWSVVPGVLYFITRAAVCF